MEDAPETNETRIDNKIHIAIRYQLCLCYNDEVYLGSEDYEFSWIYYLNWTGMNPSIHLYLLAAPVTILQNASPGLDEVDDARTIDRYVLFCYHLDDLLCYDTTEQRRCVR
jgi:hypothetical protein